MTTEIPTLKVPRPIYDEALKFCNDRLRERGKPEITELPAGVPEDAASCPCANACGAEVWYDEWRWIGDDEFQKSAAPTGFTKFFDEHAIGILVDMGKRRSAPVLPIPDDTGAPPMLT